MKILSPLEKVISSVSIIIDPWPSVMIKEIKLVSSTDTVLLSEIRKRCTSKYEQDASIASQPSGIGKSSGDLSRLDTSKAFSI